MKVSTTAATGKSQMLYAPLAEADPEIHALIEKEKERQYTGLELIASEVVYYHAF